MNEYRDVYVCCDHNTSHALAKKLCDRLSQQNITTWLDFEKADGAQVRTAHHIEMSHNIVFIVTPAAINSKKIGKEIEMAAAYNKRIVPILHIESASKGVEDQIPSVISKTDYIYCREIQNPDNRPRQKRRHAGRPRP